MKKRILAFALAFSMILGTVPVFGAATTASRLRTLEQNLPEMKALLSQCEEKGISTDYEQIDCQLIEDFIGYGREDLNQGEANRAAYVADNLEWMYDESMANLRAYLNGIKTPLAVDRYVTGNNRPTVSAEGESLFADVRSAENGKIERREVFLNGFTGGAGEAVEKMPKLGFNLIQCEVGANKIIVDPAHAFVGWRWSLWGGINAENITVEIADQMSKDGSRGLHIKNTNPIGANQYIQIEQSVSVQPNTQYELVLDAKNVSGTPTVIRTDGWSGEVFSTAANGRSTTHTLRFKTGSSKSISFWILQDQPGENVLDNFSLRMLDNPSEELFVNGNFETELPVVDGMGVDISGARAVKKILEEAEENNVAVDVLLSPHYFPDFVLSEDSTYRHGGSGFGGGGIEWAAERVRKALTLYVDSLMPELKDYKSLLSICLSNEPSFNLMYSDKRYALPLWTDYLQKKYGSIAALRKAHGNNTYTSFADVEIPNNIEQTPLYYEWQCFNEKLFGSYHQELADHVKAVVPNVLVHSKMVNYMTTMDDTYNVNFQKSGPNANEWAKFSDWNGNDAHGYLRETHNWKLQNKLQWYDFLTTVYKKPIFNSEDHFIEDDNDDYTERQARQVATDAWQSAIHGRAASSAWVYGRSYTDASVRDSILCRPDVMRVYGRASLDQNRLSAELTAMQKVEPQVAVLYSPASRLYNQTYLNTVYVAYQGAIYSGNRTMVADEEAVQAGKIDGCKLVILPDTRNLCEETVRHLDRYKANGGKVLIIGSKSISATEYNQPYGVTVSQAAERIKAGEETLAVSQFLWAVSQPSIDAVMQKVLEKVPSTKVEVLDTEGNPVKNVEWRYTTLNGRHLLNLCSYDWNADHDIVIKLDGKQVTIARNLLTDELVTNFHLVGYTPQMLELNDSSVAGQLIVREQKTASGRKLEFYNGTGRAIENAAVLCAQYDSDGRALDIQTEAPLSLGDGQNMTRDWTPTAVPGAVLCKVIVLESAAGLKPLSAALLSTP